MRQNPPWSPAALEALIIDESIHPFQNGFQVSREAEIQIERFLSRVNFKHN
jgi:hypothetical protein